MINKPLRLAILFLALFSTNSFAELVPIQDSDREYPFFHATIKANPDFTHTTTISYAIKVLDKRAIEDVKRQRVGYSTSVEKVDIIEAYNLKASGEKVDTPKDNYQVRTNKGRNQDGPVFSDRGSITVVLPEVEVGDTLYFSYKRTVSEPMFPEYFTINYNFTKYYKYDDIKLELTVPSSWDAVYKAREMEEKIISNNDATKTYLLSRVNPVPMRDTRKDYSVWDMETNPGVRYSTFNTYEAVATAYGKRALPKVQITDRVKALADEITGDIKDKREIAKLLYEWVATKITYAGNCVGVGAVVPHDISFILDNHMGDCKDHATLLEALLKYKGIESEQALVNSGNIYALPEIPVVSSVNHVINYIPEFDLFVDATSTTTPFGMVPHGIQGKPVLMVENFVEGLTIPVPSPGTHKQTVVSELTIQKDGSVKGYAKTELFGFPAISARSGWRDTSKDSEEQWLKDYFTSNGQIGSASMERDDATALEDKYNYKMDFEMKEFILTDSAGAIGIYSMTPSYLSPWDIAQVPEKIESVPVSCLPASSYEKFTYHFPENYIILDVPQDKMIEGEFIKYEASYKQNNNSIEVIRNIIDSTPGPICTPELLSKQKETLQKIYRNLRAQIVYKPVYDD